ncbi:MAG: 50S ribosomal protein L16, partial [Candidatus Bathyarchaeia archaeon]
MRGKNYRRPVGQPYARAEYIHGAPPPKISKFVMGDTKGNFEYKVSLKVKNDVQIRHNALEAARVAVNKSLIKDLGESGYMIKVKVYPHIVLRENKMIATAGADRLQEGMRRAFGKPIGRAARVKADEAVIEV